MLTAGAAGCPNSAEQPVVYLRWHLDVQGDQDIACPPAWSDLGQYSPGRNLAQAELIRLKLVILAQQPSSHISCSELHPCPEQGLEGPRAALSALP